MHVYLEPARLLRADRETNAGRMHDSIRVEYPTLTMSAWRRAARGGQYAQPRANIWTGTPVRTARVTTPFFSEAANDAPAKAADAAFLFHMTPGLPLPSCTTF